jgi:hypothetical protein
MPYTSRPYLTVYLCYCIREMSVDVPPMSRHIRSIILLLILLKLALDECYNVDIIDWHPINPPAGPLSNN